MGDVVQNAEQEFWRPPAASVVEETPAVLPVGACERCGTEFMVGARYCHACGTGRDREGGFQSLVNHLDFQNIQEKLGLSLGSLIAFLIGIGCVFGALSVRIVYTPQRLVDWQAIQLYCIQWLLGGLVAFAAGILLKKSR